MLYNSFKIIMLFTSVMGIFNMVNSSSYEYVFFPITIIVWAIFSFFDEDDKEFLRRRENYPYWTFQEHKENGYKATYQPITQGTVYTPYAQNNAIYRYNDPLYKKILPKCKQNVKISLDNKE